MLSDDPVLWPATVLLDAYRRRTISPVEAAQLALKRIADADKALNAFCLVDADGALGERAGVGGAVGQGRADGPRRRRAGDDQGPADHARLADLARLEEHPPRPEMGRGRAGGRAPARERRRHPRQDHLARIRLEGARRQPPDRHHAQSVEDRPHARRQQRRRRGGGGSGHGGAAYRHGWRRLDPHSRLVLRHLRHQADLRPRAAVSAEPLRRRLACRADDAHGRRRRADADRARGRRRSRRLRAAA